MNLARILGVVAEGQDHESGRKQLKLTTRDRYGLAHELVLGSDFDAVLRDAEPLAIEALEDEVRLALKTGYPRIEKRQELSDTLLTKLRSDEHTLGVSSPRYKQEVDAYLTTRKILELEG